MSTRRLEVVQPPVDLVAVQAVEAALEAQQLAAGLLVVEGGVLQRHADAQAHGVGLGGDVVAGDPGPPAGRQQQRAQHPHGGGLAGAVGAEEAVDLARRHLEVDAVDGHRCRRSGAGGLR